MISKQIGNGKWGDVRRDLEARLALCERTLEKAERDKKEILEQLTHLDSAIDTLNKLPDSLVNLLLHSSNTEKLVPKAPRAVNGTGSKASVAVYDAVKGLLSREHPVTARELSYTINKDYSSCTVALNQLEAEGVARCEKQGQGPKEWYLV